LQRSRRVSSCWATYTSISGTHANSRRWGREPLRRGGRLLKRREASPPSPLRFPVKRGRAAPPARRDPRALATVLRLPRLVGMRIGESIWLRCAATSTRANA
jgi:hypothetical protein